MRLGFGKNSGKFYVTIDSNPNNTVGSTVVTVFIAHLSRVVQLAEIDRLTAL